MKKFFKKHTVLLSTLATFMLTFVASSGTRCISFFWHDEPEAPAFLQEEWENY